MSRRVFVREDAVEDLQAATSWYEGQRPGLGDELTEEFDTTMRRAASTPEAFPFVLPTIRRALVKRFPYAIYFRTVGDAIQVLAVFHARRDPAVLRAKLQ